VLSFAPLDAAAGVAYDLVMAVPVPAPLAIVLLTVAVRAALLPLAARVARAANPLDGILPGLAQAPFFMVLYHLFTASTVHGGQNRLLSARLLDVHLHERFLQEPTALVFWLLFVALAAIALWTVRRMPAGTPPLLRGFAFITVFVAAIMPLAAGIYLVTSTAWTAGERVLLRREPPVSPGT
jgi:YidC/Oxa1 family membrane protein insertase